MFSYTSICTPYFFCLVKSKGCSKTTNNKLTRRKSVINLSRWNCKNISPISIYPLTPSAKRSVLFLIEFVLICAMINLFIFLTSNTFSLVVKSCSSDSEVVETGNGRISVKGLRIGRSMLVFTFSMSWEECLGVEMILLLLFVVIPKHSLSYQNVCILIKNLMLTY